MQGPADLQVINSWLQGWGAAAGRICSLPAKGSRRPENIICWRGLKMPSEGYNF